MPNVNPAPQPLSSGCFEPNESYDENYPIDTAESLCMYNSQGYECLFTVEYGNYLGAAFAKQEFNQGYCDTSDTSADANGINMYYQNDSGSGVYTGLERGPFSFNTWFQLAESGAIIGASPWQICMEHRIGTKGVDDCTDIYSEPF
jgi:hypothetical protein